MVWNEKLHIDIPLEWQTVDIVEILAKYPNTRRISTSEYQFSGKYPIFDQDSSKYIVGYTDDSTAVLHRFPAVLFGDHSTCVKLINMPFARGADGTQILYSNDASITPYYLYLSITSLAIPNPGYSRHFKYLKEMSILKAKEKIIETFEKMVTPFFQMWTKNIVAINELTKQRDELLPLLMNGQVSVNYDLSFKGWCYHILRTEMEIV